MFFPGFPKTDANLEAAAPTNGQTHEGYSRAILANNRWPQSMKGQFGIGLLVPASLTECSLSTLLRSASALVDSRNDVLCMGAKAG